MSRGLHLKVVLGGVLESVLEYVLEHILLGVLLYALSVLYASAFLRFVVVCSYLLTARSLSMFTFFQ